jgi:Zn finger protein HypA/HybF involved in hydrogenase expression
MAIIMVVIMMVADRPTIACECCDWSDTQPPTATVRPYCPECGSQTLIE